VSQIRGGWNINGNGYGGFMWIEGVDGQGNLLGSSTVYGQPIRGFWDEASGRLTFMRIINAADPSTMQIYTGYLMPPQDNMQLAIAGTFEAFIGTGATASKPSYGWYAISGAD
jgi:hypothetical protein